VTRHRHNERVVEAAGALGIRVEVTRFPQGTRTAADAAAAIGCAVAAICKSIVLDSDAGPLVVFTSGANRVDYGKVEEASGGTARQEVKLVAGISSDKAKELNKFIKNLGVKGVQSQVQGDQLRVISKKRDDLQATMKALKEEDFGIPLQFTNFRDK
jgi:hypothetical protein